VRQYDLQTIWEQQLAYNNLIKLQQERTSSEWMINYLLGITAQLSQLLEQTNWRKHPITDITEFGPNVSEELADLTKYVFSMWQVMGFTPLDMLDAMYQKGEILQQLMYQDVRPPLQNLNILMLDLDGVVADFRKGFISWLENTNWGKILTIKDEDIGLHLDLNNGWDYRAYYQAKIEFEKEGGYSHLPSIKQIKHTVNTLKQIGWYVMVYTARPYSTYKRIWGDTWTWLRERDIHVHELHFGYDDRVIAASFHSDNNHVVAIEDDPVLIRRYLGCGIPVFVYPQPYNQDMPINSPLLKRIDIDQPSSMIVDQIHSTTLTSEKESSNG
jgi:hypothetical protein